MGKSVPRVITTNANSMIKKKAVPHARRMERYKQDGKLLCQSSDEARGVRGEGGQVTNMAQGTGCHGNFPICTTNLGHIQTRYQYYL